MDVADFCLPLGGLLSPLSPNHSPVPRRERHSSADGINAGLSVSAGGAGAYMGIASKNSCIGDKILFNTVNEDKILHSSKQYSKDCFVFVLENKTVSRKNSKLGIDEDEDVLQSTMGTGDRMYGICVQQTRRLQVRTPNDTTPLYSTKSSPEAAHMHSAPHTGRFEIPNEACPKGRTEMDMSSSSTSFESRVCFAVITRFPLIDFFLEVIQQIILVDEEMRRVAGRGGYHNYIPTELLDDILGRLIRLPPPRYGK